MRVRRRFVHRPEPGLPQCHAATVVERQDGALICAWYAGAHEMARDVAIYGAFLAPGEEEWSEQVVFADSPGFSEGNPVLFLTRDGRLWLFYVTMLGERWDTCQVKYAHSLDGGIHWEPPVVLSNEWGWMTGCKPLQLPDDTLLLPLYEELGSAFVLRSQDGGRQWKESNRVTTSAGVIQPTIAPCSDGSLLMYLRTYEVVGGMIWESRSWDEGRTWSLPIRTTLPNPNARVDLTRLADGKMALAFNDTHQGRTPLSLALSEDQGVTWPYRRHIETEPGEYSYPALIQSREGLLHLVYTYRRTHIAHIACDEEWVLAGEEGATFSGQK